MIPPTFPIHFSYTRPYPEAELMAHGLALEAQGALDEARRVYEAILQALPNAPCALHRLGCCHVDEGQTHSAVPYFEQAFAMAPDEPAFYHALRWAWLQTGQHERALGLCPRPTPEEGELIGILTQNALEALEERAQTLALAEPLRPMAFTLWGIALTRQGKQEDAISVFNQAIARFPQDPELYENMAAVFLDEKAPEKALPLLETALMLDPLSVQGHYNHGLSLSLLGEQEAAINAYRQALNLNPAHTPSLANLSNLLALQSAHRDEAQALLQRAIALEPSNAAHWVNQGLLFKEARNWEQAEQALRKALSLEDTSMPAHNALGLVLGAQHRFAEAFAHLDQAVARFPNEQGTLLCNLGALYWQYGLLEKARETLEQALPHVLAKAPLLHNLALVHCDLKAWEAARLCYEQALAEAPENPDLWCGIGHVASEQGDIDKAAQCYQKALDNAPEHLSALANQAILYHQWGEKDKAAERLALRTKAATEDPEVLSEYIASFHTDPYPTPEDHLRRVKRYGALVSRKASPFTQWSAPRKPTRLRVGFVSGDLRAHPVGYFLEALVKALAGSRLDLMAYPTQAGSDALTERLRPHFVAFRPLHGQSDAQAARLIHADALHILMDLSGHTVANRLPVFAFRPAPLQLSWLGYFASTGVEQMDGVLVDEYSVPQGSEGPFTERVFYLPETRLCFTPPLAAPESVARPLDAPLVLGSFQNLAKLNSSVIALWSEVLKRLPDARLRLQAKGLEHPQVIAHLMARFATEGIAPERVDCHGAQGREAYLAAHAEVDFLLDTFPHPGGTTTCEALWMGVPTLTLSGHTLLERQGHALLSACGLPEWVAQTPSEFVDKAVLFANNRALLRNLRQNLRARLVKTPVFDAHRFAQHLEDTLWEIWKSSACWRLF
jgi:protein O-GlcNAc transferase